MNEDSGMGHCSADQSYEIHKEKELENMRRRYAVSAETTSKPRGESDVLPLGRYPFV